MPYERVPYLPMGEALAFIEAAPGEAKRQQAPTVQLAFFVHNVLYKDKKELETFYTGYAKDQKSQYNVTGVLEQDLKFGLALKLVSQETFDRLTL